MVSDTIRFVDTVFIESVTYDTTTRLIENKTVEVINNERVRLVYKYDTLTREIFHEVECKSDTVVRVVRVPVQKIQPVTVQSPRKWFDFVLYGLFIGFVVFLLYRLTNFWTLKK